MSRQTYIFFILNNMNLFNTLLQIKTGKKDLLMKLVFIENSAYWKKWTYFGYHYDNINHVFYINDLDYFWTKHRTSAINIIEHIMTKAYTQEIYSMYNPHGINRYKKPKVFCIYRQRNWLLNIDKINLKTIRWKDWKIKWFKNPSWNVNDSNNIKLEKIRNNLSRFYLNKNISK